MSDDNDNQLQDQATVEAQQLPPQTSPQDTSNWDDKPATTPNGRITIKDLSGNYK